MEHHQLNSREGTLVFRCDLPFIAEQLLLQSRKEKIIERWRGRRHTQEQVEPNKLVMVIVRQL